MTNEEAINKLRHQEKLRSKGINYQVDNLVISTAISALEKQIAKKPVKANYIVKINGVDTLLDENEFTKCPSCTYKDIEVKHGQKYCHICGQALDWSNESEELL